MVISTVWSLISEIRLTQSINALKSRKHAIAAEPTEQPLALALVTLPTASSLSVIFLTLYGSYDIYTMPPALSAIGPKPLIERTNTPVQNMPIVAIAVPNKPPIKFPQISVIPEALPIWQEIKTPNEMMTTGNPVDYMPTARPAMMLVAWPVYEALAIFWTGAKLQSVQY